MSAWRRACLGVVAAVAVAACGGGQTNTVQGPAPHGNVLQIAGPGDPDSLDPMGGGSGFDVTYLYQIYEPLINLDPNTNKLLPGLATSWNWVGANKLTLRLKLRQGVTFQDGTPFNAEAAKASLDHARTFKTWPDLVPVTSVNVVDPYTIDINVGQPYSPLPALLTWRGGMMESPTAIQKYGSDIGRHPVGAGPFAFQSWKAGDSIVLTKFKDYYQADQVHLSGLNFRIIPDQTAQINALRAGQLDVGGLADLSNLPTVQNARNLNVRVSSTTALSIVTTNNKAAPFNNVLVRRAAQMAIDRKALAIAANGKGQVNKGIGGPACQYVPPGYWPYSKDLKCWNYDPAQAKQLLAQAGYPNGVTVQLCTIQGAPTTIPVIEKQQMAKAGFNVQISVEPVNSCLSKMFNATGNMVQIGWTALADPYQTYATMFGPTTSFGPYPGVPELLAKAAASYTQDQQQAVYHQLNKTLFDLAPSMPLYYNVTAGITNKRVSGVENTKIVFVTYYKHARVQ
ncbi:MAG: hypothetical protein J2P45_06630 [Candidatus Dormibacteraeota bacterium]|nr:hypothetical protein [Candidatus Dormibacteraeota bacterium]